MAADDADDGEQDRDTERLLAAVRARIAAERGPAAWLRSRPTPQRVGLIVHALTVAVLLTIWFGARPDLAAYPMHRMALALGSYAVCLLLAIDQLLRPLHVRRDRAAGLVLGATIALPWALALLPAAVRTRAVSGAGHDDCVLVGLVAGGLLMLLLRVLDRDTGGRRLRLPLMGAAAGLFANLVLMFHCPIDRTPHLLAAHATSGLVLTLLALAAMSARALRGGPESL